MDSYTVWRLAKFNSSQNLWSIYNRTNSGLPSNNLICVFTQNNIKWIGTLGAGLAKFDDTNWVVYNPKNSLIPSNTINQISLDSLGNIWIATAGGLAVHNPNGVVSIQNNKNENVSQNFMLYQNYPNPFNPITTISYQLPKAGLVNISVYDITGKEVAKLVSEFKEAGSYDVIFNASNLSSGIYFYSLKADGFADTKKLVVIK